MPRAEACRSNLLVEHIKNNPELRLDYSSVLLHMLLYAVKILEETSVS